jgi:uncharacterized protein (TIGR02266 family)
LRRRDAHLPARIEVRFTELAAAARVLRAYSLNFSVGGMCLRTRRKYPLGSLLHLFVKIENEEYRIAAVVAWTRGDAIGVRFQNLDREARLRFTQLVMSLQG